MNTRKKEILLVSLTCALGIVALVVDIIRHPLAYPAGYEVYAVLWMLSGYQGIIFSQMGFLAFYSKPGWMLVVTPVLAHLSFPLTMIFSKGIFIAKRIAFSYFITMYMVVILFELLSYLMALKII